MEMERTPDGQVTQPEITSSSCGAILRCTRKIFTAGFPEFQEEAENNLIKLVEDFSKDIENVHNYILTTDESLDRGQSRGYFNACMNNLVPYKKLARSFYDFVYHLDKTDEEIEKETLLNSTIEFKDYMYQFNDKVRTSKSETLMNCFWFERYFWWRFRPISNCYSSVITKGISPNRDDTALLSKLENKLLHPGQLAGYCNMETLTSLLKTAKPVISVDPWYVPFDLCFNHIDVFTKTYDLPSLPTPQKDGIKGPPMLDPNDPVFQAIEKVSCFFYPITNPQLPPHESIQEFYNDFQNPLLDLTKYNNILQNISDTLQRYKSGITTLKKSQIARFTLHPKVNERRVEADFKYYQNVLTKNAEMIEKVFSKFEIYGHIFEIFDMFKLFSLVSLKHEDFTKVDFFRHAEELGGEFKDVKRCFEG